MLDADRSRSPILATVLLNRLIRGMLPQMSRDPINVDNDDLYCKALEVHQRKNKGSDTWKDPPFFIKGAKVAIPQEDKGLWLHSVIVKPNNDDHRGHYHTGDKDWLDHDVELYMQYQHSTKGIPMQTDNKIFREIPDLYKQWSVNITRET